MNILARHSVWQHVCRGRHQLLPDSGRHTRTLQRRDAPLDCAAVCPWLDHDLCNCMARRQDEREVLSCNDSVVPVDSHLHRHRFHNQQSSTIRRHHAHGQKPNTRLSQSLPGLAYKRFKRHEFHLLIILTSFQIPGLYSGFTTALAWISNTLPRPPAKRAAALAFISAAGNSTAIYTSYLYPKSAGPRYMGAWIHNSVMAALSILAAFVLSRMLARLNEKLDRGESVKGAVNAAPGEAVEGGFRFLV